MDRVAEVIVRVQVLDIMCLNPQYIMYVPHVQLGYSRGVHSRKSDSCQSMNTISSAQWCNPTPNSNTMGLLKMSTTKPEVMLVRQCSKKIWMFPVSNPNVLILMCLSRRLSAASAAFLTGILPLRLMTSTLNIFFWTRHDQCLLKSLPQGLLYLSFCPVAKNDRIFFGS